VQAEGGGWKLSVNGTMTPTAEGETASELDIAYDGTTVRSLRPTENAVYEKDNVVEMSELAVFMAGQSAKPPVAWEILEPKPLEASGGRVEFEGQEEVGGEMCDVVRIHAAGAETGGGPAATDADAGLRVFVAEGDHLPRRIERLVYAGGVPGARVLTMKDVKANTAEERGLALVSFVLEAPSDYTHRTVQAALRDSPTGRGGSPSAGARPEPSKLDLAMEPLAVGTPAPDWELPVPGGGVMKLSEHAGKVVVLDFWGTWCPYCLKAMPDIQRLHESYKDRGVVVLGLNTENSPRADPAGFMKQKGYTYGLVLNAERITRSYRVFGYPTLYVIGRDGKVALVEQGAKPDLYGLVARVIDAELGL
jgi:thiol-disulfide isomerase/thioredoxin